jgi:3-deoxy-manno-octulosonate cytidylyltransferase (CMP-KDO synthetase)
VSVVIVIPARYASSRFPGKPLAPLTGATGVAKPLIRRSWEAAMAVAGVDRVVVATDDDRIADVARGFGADVVMTSEACGNGTERCADALAQLGDVEIVVNLQGDAPLTPPWFVEALVGAMRADPAVEVATPALACDAEHLAALRADRRVGRVGATTAVMRRNGDAIYFSKEVLPFADGTPPPEVFHHVGVYAYRPEALRAYVRWPAGPLERAEGLEQLRFIENGRQVRCVTVESRGAGFWELNNPSDRERIEMMLRDRGIA